ncbi:hypothetical protein OOJ91_13745 [Micromonospora lupini]|uniref:hypothetical protein n=1 Tax=Micromonospora lupini TaxID=285679 RepID=UPI00224CCA2E|nr:hypothetical protein [Micromonospora lupini]MCX5066910.1 hypothetical protein [Micromonospora lupini]
MAKLTESTHVRHPKTGELAFLIAGGDVPDWAAPLVGDHLVQGGAARRGKVTPEREDPAAELARLEARIAELRATPPQGSPAQDDGGDADPDGPPPKGGPGSGAPAWRAYAARRNVEVAEDASREDVWEALDKAGVPTE